MKEPVEEFDLIGVRPPVKDPRVVISVSLSHEEFARIAEVAKHLGVPISRFLRESVIDKLRSKSFWVNTTTG